ncbi:MAG: transposase, partial [Planctomycetaceae bacterium]|nr:transposase [Planctomycetaceae bacterium]
LTEYIKTLEQLIAEAVLPLPARVRLLYDKAADSEMLRWILDAINNIIQISPNKCRRNEKAARKLHHLQRMVYRKRYRIERTFAWLKNSRRLQVRHEYHPQIYKSFWIVGILFTMGQKL